MEEKVQKQCLKKSERNSYKPLENPEGEEVKRIIKVWI